VVIVGDIALVPQIEGLNIRPCALPTSFNLGDCIIDPSHYEAHALGIYSAPFVDKGLSGAVTSQEWYQKRGSCR